MNGLQEANAAPAETEVVATTHFFDKPLDISGKPRYPAAQDKDDPGKHKEAPMSKEPLKIESLADGESSILGEFARIETKYLDLYKDEPYWAERIEKLKMGLTTPMAKQIAAYLLGDETCGEDAPPAEQAAWKYAQDMMLQVQPGFRERLVRGEEEIAAAKAR